MSIEHSTLNIRPPGASRSGRPAGPGEGLRLPLARSSAAGPSRSRLFALVLAAAAAIPSAQSAKSAPADLPALLAAIRQAESAGDDRAVGDGGKSCGPYQIQRAYWREAVAGTDAAGWDYDVHVWNPDRAGYVVWLHWCKVCPAALRAGNLELLARRHRLPNDPWRSDNAAYWRRVRAAMEGAR